MSNVNTEETSSTLIKMSIERDIKLLRILVAAKKRALTDSRELLRDAIAKADCIHNDVNLIGNKYSCTECGATYVIRDSW